MLISQPVASLLRPAERPCSNNCHASKSCSKPMRQRHNEKKPAAKPTFEGPRHPRVLSLKRLNQRFLAVVLAALTAVLVAAAKLASAMSVACLTAF